MQMQDTITNCNHIHRVAKWGLDASSNYTVTVWDCSLCGIILDKPVEEVEQELNHDYDFCSDNECFVCKIKTLSLNAGDAKSGFIENGYTQKSWDRELKEYRDARAQGIQPKTTRLKDVRAAVEASDKTGKAFDASKPH